MLSPQQTRRMQKILIGVGAGLAAYYFFIFHPLAERAEAANKPLLAAWNKVAQTRIRGNGDKLDIADLDQQLKQAKSAAAALDRARERIEESVASESAARMKNHEPFQLVDFQIDKLVRIEEIGRAAQQNNITIAPAVYTNFPDYRADRSMPELLWAQLSFVDHLLATAIRCKVTSIQNIDVPPYESHSRSTNEAPYLYEVPMRVHLTGSMESISKFLASLPLRSKEMTVAKLPESPADKPALFVDRFILTKSSPEKPDEADLDLRVCGFVYRD